MKIGFLAERAMDWASARRVSIKRVGFAAAFLLFIGGLYFALTEVPDLWGRIRIGPLLLLFLIGPLVTTLHSATEFCLTARAAGSPVRWWNALEITILANAANLLPVPGGVVARVAALRAHGSGFGRGSFAVLLFGFIWGGFSFCYSAAALVLENQKTVAAVFAIIGIFMLAFAVAGFMRLKAPPFLPLLASLMRLASLPLEALRLMLAAWGVGADISFGQASVLVVSSFLGLAVSIVPAGLGVREAAIALLSPTIGIAPAVGFLAGVAGRIIYMIGQVAAAAIVFIFAKRRSGEALSQQASIE